MTEDGMSCQGIYVTVSSSSQSELWFSTFKSTQHQDKGTSRAMGTNAQHF